MLDKNIILILMNLKLNVIVWLFASWLQACRKIIIHIQYWNTAYYYSVLAKFILLTREQAICSLIYELVKLHAWITELLRKPLND